MKESVKEIDLTVKHTSWQGIKNFYQKRRTFLLVLLPLLLLTTFAVYIQYNLLNTKGKAAGTTLNVRDYGAKGDGVTDDTSAIRAAINQTAAGNVVYFPAGTYKITSTITLPSNAFLQGEGATSIIHMDETSGSMFSASGTSGVTFQDMAFKASSYTTDTAAIRGQKIDNLIVRRCLFDNLRYALKLNIYPAVAPYVVSRGWTIEDVTITNSKMGIYLGYLEDSTFTRVSSSQGSSSTNLVHPLYVDEGCHNLTFTDLTLTRGAGVGGYAVQFYRGREGSSSGITINGLVTDSSAGGYPIWIGPDVDNLTIDGWTSITTTNGGPYHVSLSGATNILIKNFTAKGGSRLIYGWSGSTNDRINLVDGVYDGPALPTSDPNISNLSYMNVRLGPLPTPTPTSSLMPSSTPTSVPTPTATPTPTPTFTPTPIPTIVPTVPLQASYGITVMAIDTRRGSQRLLVCSITASSSVYSGTTSYTRNSSTPISVTLTAPIKCQGRTFSSWATGATSRTTNVTDSTVNNGEQVYTAYYR